MSIGSVWGFIKGKLGSAAFLDTGTGAGDVVQLNGSAQLPAVDGSLLTGVGGGSVPSDWTIVSTLAGLNTAISGGSARVLIDADITVSGTSQIQIPTNSKIVIGRKIGFQIIHSGSQPLFTYGSGAELSFFDPYEDGLTLPFIDASAGSATYLFDTTDSSYRLRVTGDHFSVECDAFTLRGAGPVNISCERVTLILPNGATLSGSVTWDVGRLEIVGGGSSCYAIIAGNASRSSQIGALRLTGTFRTVSTSGIGEPAVTLSGSMFVGAITGIIGATDYVMADEGVTIGVCRLETGGIACRNASVLGGYIPYLQLADVGSFGAPKNLIQAATIGQFAYTVTRAVFNSCILSADASPVSFGSGTEPEFISCTIPSGLTLTFASGSGARARDCDIEGTLVLASGCAARLSGNRGAGTLTNNDPLSIVTGSEDVRWDTTPATRAFADSSGVQSATLNTELLPFVVGYWDGASLPGPNRGPALPSCVGGPLCDVTSNKALSVSGGKIDVDSGSERFHASLPLAILGSDYFVSFYHTPDDATPGGETHLLSMDGATNSNGFDLLASGALRVYQNGAGSYGDSSSAVMSDGVESRLTWLRRDNAGTNTIYIYVDGVEVGALTGKTLNLNASVFLSNTNSTAANPGQYRRILAAVATISEATENLLDTYWLQGAGNA